MRSAALLSLLPLALAAPVQEAGAPVLVPRGATANSKYIVRLKKPAADGFSIQSTAGQVTSCINSIVADAEERYDNVGAFSAHLDDADLASLRANPSVAYIEKDATMSLQVTQTGAPWGLARLSNTAPGSTTYTYDATAGAGACVYIIDSGVDVSHPEFEGRASQPKNAVDSDAADRNGHGTHVAGTIGSKTYGVAKKTKIFSVKVFGASGQTTNAIVMAGMDWVVADAPKRAAECPRGIVVNMSLGGGASQAIDDAAAAMVSSGLAVMVAAGNGDSLGRAVSASTSSPARAPSVCTIGATDRSDKVGTFSNYGPLVDVHGPGVSILSTLPDGRTGTLTGTSMATPHVAGLAAYFLGTGQTTAANACSFIVSKAQSGVISGLRSDTKNLLIHN
ncbi:peptidase S8/S53 domain-containing protein [Microdochium trichocladiopsis]|uniref:Peptidase S8/S53 domain-containing protein n=1 Tax=Microdochium trichocladiopsis TaxID=1682393 RepID=A0A9P8YF47_9PEZI|nr:peptidase S8/S53 domain-containing protein [Microdochium trichocladiopsis]KAH7038300.1 peptidase S8/S53 domain-containing protein [Microdochium trichocladiopsis]